ncbi:hypothetical protein [Cupriavidus sp. Marseille-Q8015]
MLASLPPIAARTGDHQVAERAAHHRQRRLGRRAQDAAEGLAGRGPGEVRRGAANRLDQPAKELLHLLFAIDGQQLGSELHLLHLAGDLLLELALELVGEAASAVQRAFEFAFELTLEFSLESELALELTQLAGAIAARLRRVTLLELVAVAGPPATRSGTSDIVHLPLLSARVGEIGRLARSTVSRRACQPPGGRQVVECMGNLRR